MFRDALEVLAGEIRPLIALPCQTNEVGRAAALLFGFLPVARATGLPFRLVELGASGGLNLRWDRFFYRSGRCPGATRPRRCGWRGCGRRRPRTSPRGSR